MCGFVIGNIFENRKQFKKSLDLISHRGKDNQTIEYDNDTNTHMGHNRLSIQGLNDESNQPMTKDEYTLVYNGELWRSMDNCKKDFSLNTGSDTELLLNLFHLKRESCIKDLDGMFGFAVYDKQKKSILFARDFMGRIPLYYYRVDKRIVIASELKSITNIFNINASDVTLVEPGCYYIFDYDTGKLKQERFYDFPLTTDIEDMSEEYVMSGIKNLLIDGVNNELISDVPVCTILSGGVDSTIITYLLKQKIPNLQAFVVSMGDTGKKDDLYYARMASKEIGLPLHEVIIDKDWIQQNLSEAIYAIEDYIKKRRKLIVDLHKNNLIRTNKAMMYGGTVELRTPFLHKNLVEFCLKIPPKFKKEGQMWKPLLRKTFKGELSDELLFRPKKTFQEGCHTIYLKNTKETIKEYYISHYEEKNSLEKFMESL